MQDLFAPHLFLNQSMRSLRPLLLLLVTALAFASSLRAAQEILSAETVIADPVHDPVWSELFRALAAPKTRVSRFEERRHFPFREKPIVLTGEIRIIPGRGLSLSYLTPKPQMVIVDEAGVLLRDGRGRQRSAPADSRAQAATAALFSILRFDLPDLARQFVIHGTRAGKKWTLGFVPKDPALAGLMGTVIVAGEARRINRIDLTKSDHQRIEIIILSTMEDVIFGDEVVKRFFR